MSLSKKINGNIAWILPKEEQVTSLLNKKFARKLIPIRATDSSQDLDKKINQQNVEIEKDTLMVLACSSLGTVQYFLGAITSWFGVNAYKVFSQSPCARVDLNEIIDYAKVKCPEKPDIFIIDHVNELSGVNGIDDFESISKKFSIMNDFAKKYGILVIMTMLLDENEKLPESVLTFVDTCWHLELKNKGELVRVITKKNNKSKPVEFQYTVENIEDIRLFDAM